MAWRFPLTPHSLWYNFIQSKFDANRNTWDASIDPPLRMQAWKFLHSCYHHFQAHFHFEIGIKDNVRFWEDISIGELPLKSYFRHLGGRFSWNLHFTRNLNDGVFMDVAYRLNQLSSFHFSYRESFHPPDHLDRQISRVIWLVFCQVFHEVSSSTLRTNWVSSLHLHLEIWDSVQI